ncbi:3',5'-cyclic adenosine monophosphate phosphodiesterase CpdA [mine drainage metagenome]|uniref:3',5'-cyclic adenosine monophosphate phosphodiesterase CpdA n=1 Tax=mine drainage metagenome TaxID=410659 RepID=A0A1J5U176_9ZZZZ
MRIHVLSDLHIEIAAYQPQPVECDVVVLAGDIGNHVQGMEWGRHSWPAKEILYVPGNHEFYRLGRVETLRQMRVRANELGVHLLDNDEVVIAGIRFLGSTLWTDFDLFGEELKKAAMAEGKKYLNDFRLIRERFRMFSPARSAQLHKTSRAWLAAKLQEPFPGKTVVVTHHLPSARSVAERYRASLTSACFASNLDELMGASALWIHGHTHDSFDYVLHGTRVVCNPRGYCRNPEKPENLEFDPGLVVEV